MVPRIIPLSVTLSSRRLFLNKKVKKKREKNENLYKRLSNKEESSFKNSSMQLKI